MVVGLVVVGCFAGLCGGNEGDSRIIKNMLYSPHARIRIDSDADFDSQFSNRTIWGVEINGTAQGICIFIGNCSQPFTVKDCYLHHAGGNNSAYFYNTGLYLYKSRNGTISNNVVSQNGDRGMYVYYSDSNAISSNIICSNMDDGLYLTSSNGNLISCNTIYSNIDCGIYISSSTNNTISDNNATSNTDDGISISSSMFATISDNILYSNSDDGIYLSSSNSNNLSYNNVSSNLDHGIYLSSSDGNRIFNNDIVSDTDYGIYISGTSSTYNSINHNNLIDNNPSGKQAYDSSGSNFWNTSAEGNFWSDWANPDNDSNGIVDFPYSLAGGASVQDFYPLAYHKVTPRVPSAPQNLKSSIKNLRIVLTWQPPFTDGGSPITNYEVYRAKTSGTEIHILETGNVLTYTDSSVSPGVKYFYKISAKNNIGEGPLSNEISNTVHTKPSAPFNLKATVNVTQIKLTWNAPNSTGDTPIRNYRIFWGTPSGNYTETITIGNLTTYTFTDLTQGVRYYFVVSALNTMGEGPKSNEASTIIEQKNKELIPFFTFLSIMLVIVIITVIAVLAVFFKRKRKLAPVVPAQPPYYPNPGQNQ
jgi:parallel beta-helix repeat protein